MIFDEYPHMMDWWFGLFGPYTWLIMVFGAVIYLTASYFIAYFVHKDAVRRNITNSEAWLVIGLILNIFGLILYLLVRGNYRLISSKGQKMEHER